MRHKPILIGIIILSTLFRVAATLYLGDQVVVLPGTADQVSYHTLATRVMDGYGFTFGQNWWPVTKAGAPTAHWSYLYTFYLVMVYRLVGSHPLAARLLQAVLVGILHPLLAYALGRRVFGRAVGLVAAAWSAIYGYFVYYAATLMTEPDYIIAVLGSLYLAILLTDRAHLLKGQRPQASYYFLAFTLGLVLGMTVLMRQIFLLVIPFIFIWIWWSARLNRVNSPIPAICISSVVIVLMILPFTAYNYFRFDRFVLLNTNAGYALFLANHPIYGTHFEPILPAELGSYSDLIPKELVHLDEAALDQELLKRGLEFILDDPVRYFMLSVSRIPAFINFWPLRASSTLSNLTRMTSFGLALPFMLLGIGFWFKDRWGDGVKNLFASPGALLILIAFIYTIIHLLTWTLIRYRLPVDAILIIFAAHGVVRVISRIKILSPSFKT